jgi:hypothetical protein
MYVCMRFWILFYDAEMFLTAANKNFLDLRLLKPVQYF